MVKIHFKGTKFRINCGYHENDFPTSLPDVKWHKATKTWLANPTRLNVSTMHELIPKFKAIVSPEALQKISEVMEVKITTSDVWPENYVFHRTPKPHQLDGVRFLYPIRNSALLMDVGTGKTQVAIDVANARYQNNIINGVLVVGLVSIKYNWRDEILIEVPDADIHVLETAGAGVKNYHKWLQKEGGFKWLIVGVESFSNGSAYELCEIFLASGGKTIIVDESSSIKTHNARRTEKCIELGKKSNYKMIMTGTPITQGLQDFYSQFEFLDPDIIGVGNFYAFRGRYMVMGGKDNKILLGYKKMDEVIRATKPHIFQVRKRDVLKDLPESSYAVRSVEMTGEQKALYKELKDKLRVEYNGNKLTVKNAMNVIQRLSEITGGNITYEIENPDILTREKRPIIYQRQRLKTAPKALELKNFINECSADDSIIIWAVWTDEIDIITEMLSGSFPRDEFLTIRGGGTAEERHNIVSEFNKKNARFLVGNQRVGGIGLNMTVSSTMVYYSNDFSLEKRIQSEGRIERMGQLNKMLYVDLLCRGSVDVMSHQALANKNDFAETVRAAFDNGGLLDLI